jgi:ribosomal protein L37E
MSISRSTSSAMVADWITTSASTYSRSLSPFFGLIFHRRKREARAVHRQSAVAQKAFGLKAKLLHAKRHAEKVQLKKTLKAHDERNVKQKDSSNVPEGALPPSCSIAKAKRTPRPCLLRSSKKERIRRQNMPYLCPKSAVSQKTRCLRSCGLGRARRSRGSVWSQRPPSSETVSPVNPSKWSAS